MTTHHTSGAADLPEALRNATIIRDWCTDCRIPLPSDDECARLVAALAAGQAVAPAEPTPDELRAIAREARNSSGSASDDCGSAMYVLYGWRAAMSKASTPAMDGAWKDHKTAQLVNELRDIAVEFHGAQQLRERIAQVIVPLTDKLKAGMDGGEDAERWLAWAGAMVEACNAPGLNPDFILALSTAVGEAEIPITLEQLNAWTDAARAAQKEGEKP